MNKTLMTDFYELTMAQTYYNEGKKDEIISNSFISSIHIITTFYFDYSK